MEQVQVSEGEGKVVPKRKCPALKSLSAGMGLKESRQLHLESTRSSD